MISTFPNEPSLVRILFLIVAAIIASLIILAFLPMLLRLTSFQQDHTTLAPVCLVPLVSEKVNQGEFEEEPPAFEEIEIPEIEIPEPESLPPLVIETPIQNKAVKTVIVPAAPQNVDPALHQSGMFRSSKKRFNMNEVDRVPTRISNKPPHYPYRARRMSIEGYVKVRFLVDCSGAIHDLTIIEARPEGVFEPEVMKTLPRWKFKPARKDGRTVETWMKTTIEFKLTG